jgi:outer membrane protein TolC
MKRILSTLFLMAALATTVPVRAQDSLQTYILAAIRNNPAVAASFKSYMAQVEGACGAGQLNDPELSVGMFPKAMNHVNGKQIATFSLMQMFPWFGSLKAGRKQMEWKAEAAFQQFREDGIALAFDVQKAWYAMLATQEKIKSYDAKLRLLRDIRKTALYQYKSPTMARGSKMSDQLRINAEEARLEEQMASWQSVLQLQKEQFNLLLHRSTALPVVLPDSIVLRQMPPADWQAIVQNSPSLSRFKAEEQSYSAQAARAKAMGGPMIGVGIEYMLNGKVDMPVMPKMNGNDMLMPMLKVTLPVYRRRIKSAVRSANLLKESAEAKYERQQDVLRAQSLSISQRTDDVVRKLRLYDRETEILNNTLRLLQDEYVNGTSSLTDILQTEREQIDYELKKAEARADFNTLVAEYEKLASMYDYSKRN